MTTSLNPVTTPIDAEHKDWSLDATIARLKRAGERRTVPTTQPNAAFTADGHDYARHGSIIAVDGDGYHLGAPGLAVYFFRRITEATL